MSEKEYIYTIVNTKWGKLGIVGSYKGVKEIILPGISVKEMLKNIMQKYKNIKRDDTFFRTLETMLQDYFSGKVVDLSFQIDTDEISEFEKQVYEAVMKVKYGEVKTYSWVAQEIMGKSAVRAVGQALAKNTIPLVIPCHRIIPKSGEVGGYTAPGGKQYKKRLLKLEGAKWFKD